MQLPRLVLMIRDVAYMDMHLYLSEFNIVKFDLYYDARTESRINEKDFEGNEDSRDLDLFLTATENKICVKIGTF